MQYAGIYAITDDSLCAGGQILTAVEAALAAGINLLQYRSKSGTAIDRKVIASQLQSLCTLYQVPLIINDDIDLCLTVGAAGVHLGRQDTTLETARNRLGVDAIVGITCHSSLDLALAAELDGADYVAFGRFFPSQTKPQAPPADLSLLSEARRQLSVPIVAIGGINAENGAAVVKAGAHMLAVVHAIFGSNDIAASTQQLVNLFETTRTASETHRIA